MTQLGPEIDIEDASDRLGGVLASAGHVVMLLPDGTVLQVRLTSVTAWIPDIGSADPPNLEIRGNVTAAHDLPRGAALPLPIHEQETP